MSQNTSKGFTIMEVIIAIFILTVGIFGSYAMFQQIIRTTSINQSRLVAYYSIQEIFETIRNKRDSNWLTRPVIPWDSGLSDACVSPRLSPCDFYGDVNSDGVVNSADSGLCASCIQGGDEFCLRCDVDGASPVTSNDITEINNYISCSINTFAVCSSGGHFQKQVNIFFEDSNKMRVSSTVSWIDRGKSYNVSAVDYLYNWR